MDSYEVDAVWKAVEKEFKRLAEQYGGNRTPQEAARIAGLTKADLQRYLKERNIVPPGPEEVEDAAFGYIEDQAKRGMFNVGESHERGRHRQGYEDNTTSEHGSLQSIAAYAEAFPLVHKAREHLLGQPDPLTYQRAVTWLKEEAAKGGRGLLVEVTHRFVVPRSLGSSLGLLFNGKGKFRLGGDLLNFLSKKSVGSFCAPGKDRPFKVSPQRRSIYIEEARRVMEINLLSTGSEKLLHLAHYAELLAGYCAGDVKCNSDIEGHEGIEAAVWLILAGIWPRISIYSQCSHRRERRLPFLSSSESRDAPCINMKILSMDTPPEEVASVYRRLRKRAGIDRRGKGKGRKMQMETELLCLAEIEAKEVDGIRKGQPGFWEAVLKRYEAKCVIYGLKDRERFSLTKPDKERMRKRLEGAKKAYERLSPSSSLLIPVKYYRPPLPSVSKRVSAVYPPD